MNRPAASTTLGVIGAGTMGAGIAQVGLAAGMRVVLCDPVPGALERGVERIAAGIEKGRQKGLWSVEASTLDSRLDASRELVALEACDVVVEAAPEELALKQRIIGELGAVVAADAVIASNTSSIPITLIAAAAVNPAQIVGLHFFNPVPLMELVEAIEAAQTSPETLARATEFGSALGKRVIVAPDSPGFLVNRCGRSFSGEALRLLQERVAAVEQIDRICRMAGGFRMGPFELMDLVGIDVGFAIAKSFADLSFGEPRWRPSALQARMAAGGQLGRKTGRGWYAYEDGAHRGPDPDPPTPGGGAGRTLAVVGAGALANHLRAAAGAAGFSVTEVVEAGAVATVFADPNVVAADLGDAPHPLVCCTTHSLAFRGIRAAVGFNLPNLAGHGRLVELTRTRATPPESIEVATEVFRSLGAHQEWVADGPGLVLERMLAQIVNEAAFALGEGVGTADDIDTGMTLGLNYPRGPIAWAQLLGWDRVRQTLDGIWTERREERYRPAPALIAAAAEQEPAAAAAEQEPAAAAAEQEPATGTPPTLLGAAGGGSK
jgi:3-hydroxybutyryl-CoA dehydrogenase